MKMRNDLGTSYRDEQLADLYPKVGQPVVSPWWLALMTIVKFAEGMTDREAAKAVRSRIDLKYLLALKAQSLDNLSQLTSLLPEDSC
jgi:transposase